MYFPTMSPMTPRNLLGVPHGVSEDLCVLRSDLPFGSEFSPSRIDLVHLLELANELGGDWRRFEEAVRLAYFEGNATSEYNRRKLANNTKLGMIAYGLIDREANLTALGREMWAKRGNEGDLYRTLARHILLNLHGMSFVQCIQDIQAGGETVDLVKLREWLEERGIHYPRGGKHPSMMRLWLEKAGVFVSGWRVNEVRIEELLGTTVLEMDALAVLTLEQRAYLKTLAGIGEEGPFSSNDVEKLAAATYGVRFNEKSVPKSVLYPLERAGYLELVRGTKEAGRGAKPFLITPTERLKADLILPLLEQIEKQTMADLRPFLRRSWRSWSSRTDTFGASRSKPWRSSSCA